MILTCGAALMPSLFLGAQAEKPAPEERAPSLAAKALDAAVAKAARKNRRVLVAFTTEGDERCAELLTAMEKDRGLAHEMLYEYVLAPVAAQEARALGLPPVDTGAPWLAVLDGSRRLLASISDRDLFPSGSGLDAKSLLAKLKKLRAAPQDAKVLLEDALARAFAEKKRVFVRFDAPW
ncbi:MAG: hypothetical protein Fur0037_00920 [Planctomycetota bacterium]